jgi:GTP pyrophosphokinase
VPADSSPEAHPAAMTPNTSGQAVPARSDLGELRPAPPLGADVSGADADDPVQRALAFAAGHLAGQTLASGELVVAHARGTVRVLGELLADRPAQLAGALFAGAQPIALEAIEARFGRAVRELVQAVRQVARLRDLHLDGAARSGEQIEALRRMTLAMAADVRVVLVRLASRLQTLRYYAQQRRLPPPALSRQTLEVLAPLANRLGLGQLKWEMEDYAFRFLQPQRYKWIAAQLEEKRHVREAFVARAIAQLEQALREAGIQAQVSGRPKHIYSIHSKMLAKGLALEEIRDLRALRVIVPDVRACYEVLSVIHAMWTPCVQDFDDYIARPKPNGYQSLHTVVLPQEDGQPLEVQIRSRAMHQHAEYGVAAHWAYKEQSTGVAGAAQVDAADHERLSWVRQLLAWQRELGQALGAADEASEQARFVYALTPQGRVLELAAGATAVDFAYHVHTELGHRCRGARIDGVMQPLNTVLQNGQTVEIITARGSAGREGPSRDWLNAELGFVRTPRARAKVRQWFTAIDHGRDLAEGRARIEKVLQREGRTTLAFEELAARLSFATVEALFVAVAREEVGNRTLEEAVRGKAVADESVAAMPRSSGVRSAGSDRASVLVVGVDLLLTQLARCCRPAPPDPIVGFVTRGRGVSVHRSECATFARMRRQSPERVLETAWANATTAEQSARYPVDVIVRAMDRQGLLRDVSEVFARQRLNVISVKTLTRAEVASMQFTLQVPDTTVLANALRSLTKVAGVISAQRRAA